MRQVQCSEGMRWVAMHQTPVNRNVPHLTARRDGHADKPWTRPKLYDLVRRKGKGGS